MLSQALKARLAVLEGIPSLPVLVETLLLTIEHDDFTAEDLEKIIRQDPAMSSRLLRVANSSFFGHSGKVGTLERAIVLLGSHFVQALALSTSIIDTLAYGREIGPAPWEGYWLHSFACGWVCHRLVERGLFTEAGEEAFLCGLLHDLGKPILWVHEAAAYREVIARIRNETLRTHDAEKAVLGGDHSEVGGALAGWWHFPQGIREGIEGHHDPKPETWGACLMQVADVVSHSAWFSDGLRVGGGEFSIGTTALNEVDARVLAEVAQELLERDHEIQDLAKLLRA